MPIRDGRTTTSRSGTTGTAWTGRTGASSRWSTNGFANAFFAPPPFGPEGGGAFGYGEIDGTSFAVEDIVAHELMHGVTHFAVSQRTGVPYPLGDVYATLGPASFRYTDGRVFTCNNLRPTYSRCCGTAAALQ